MNTLRFYNGVEIPAEGYGVFQIPDHAECERCVSDALETGYRLIDTAASYFNEEAVGNAIASSGIKRDELFITTKLWLSDAGYEKTLKAFDTSLKKLKLDYLDLYLIHQPYNDYYGSWRAMEKLYKEGLIKAIGVCNFASDRLADLAINSEITPMIDQIEIHPFYQQQEAINVMKEYNVLPQAWGPLAEGQKDIFNNPVLCSIAQKYGKTAAQVILRWHTQRGVIIIPKSSKKSRMEENINIWDFELSPQDMDAIANMDTGYSEIIDHRSPMTVKRLNNLTL